MDGFFVGGTYLCTDCTQKQMTGIEYDVACENVKPTDTINYWPLRDEHNVIMRSADGKVLYVEDGRDFTPTRFIPLTYDGQSVVSFDTDAEYPDGLYCGDCGNTIR